MCLLTERMIVTILQRFEKATQEEKPDFTDIRHEALGISKTMWKSIMIIISEMGLIKGTTKIPDGDSKLDYVVINDARITLKGRDYLADYYNALKVLGVSTEISV
ncbi:MAG: YjcQ family protein [Bacillota bacterium]|nr:YjcQ family protein [Bacillota bacterium]